jgi:hypothetical protein
MLCLKDVELGAIGPTRKTASRAKGMQAAESLDSSIDSQIGGSRFKSMPVILKRWAMTLGAAHS